MQGSINAAKQPPQRSRNERGGNVKKKLKGTALIESKPSKDGRGIKPSSMNRVEWLTVSRWGFGEAGREGGEERKRESRMGR